MQPAAYLGTVPLRGHNPGIMHRFANPARFQRIANAVLPWFAVATALLLAFGLYFALFDSPADYQQGETVRIMYIHVPAAGMALFVHTFSAAASAAALIWRHPLADVAARAASPIGAGFTFLALASGSPLGEEAGGGGGGWGG